jgi:hypothetical protein
MGNTSQGTQINTVERQHRRASSRGGISSLGQRGRRALHFSGESSKGRGRTKPWPHISLDLVARLVRSLLCIQVPLYCITCCISCFDRHYIDKYPKLVFPGGVLSRVMLTKNTRVKFMHA